MTDRVSVGATSALAEGRDLVVGSIDLYVHGAPDLIPRSADDIGLATCLRDAGIGAAVHRHHFCATAERCTLVRSITGFDLRGAILCNDSVGGLNPAAVELAIEMGAVWIGLPTLSSAAQRARSAQVGRFPKALGFGSGCLTLCRDDGRLKDEAEEIIRLAHRHDRALNLGYGSFAECRAVMIALASIGFDRAVITNPVITMGFDGKQLAELMVGDRLIIEQTCYSLHPSGSYGGRPETLDEFVALVRRFGAERFALSSDGGVEGAPKPPELLAWGCAALLERGLSPAQISMMVSETPRRVVGIQLG